MAPQLSSQVQPVVQNFYENSFKQCTAIQQRQVGLLVGAAVADAAARPLSGWSRERIAALEQSMREQQQQQHARECGGDGSDVDTTLAFADVDVLPDNDDNDATVHDTAASAPSSSLSLSHTRMLSYHSFSYLLFYQLLKTMSAARGDFDVAEVAPLWVGVASAVPPPVYSAQHGSLLHTAATLLPLPCTYPYASDATLYGYAQPFVNLLMTPPATSATHMTQQQQQQHKHVHDDNDDDARVAVSHYTACVQSTLLRFLQRNPDAVRNAALTAPSPHCAAVFPPDMHDLVARYHHHHDGNARGKDAHMLPPPTTAAAAASSSSLPAWPPRALTADAEVVRESMLVARSARSFASGVVRALRAGGVTVCQRAMLVGAMLGAKFGVRGIPHEWLNATVDGAAVATLSLEVAQWSWNPPHH